MGICLCGREEGCGFGYLGHTVAVVDAVGNLRDAGGGGKVVGERGQTYYIYL